MARVDFCGGLERGSTLIARETTGRQARLIESRPEVLRPDHPPLAGLQRWQCDLESKGANYEEILAGDVMQFTSTADAPPVL
jgi:hypothetical protein